MSHQRSLELTEGQRHDLFVARDHDSRPYVRERCAAVLKIAEGVAPSAVARHGLLKPRGPDTVSVWLAHFQRDGLAGRLAHQQGGLRRRHL